MELEVGTFLHSPKPFNYFKATRTKSFYVNALEYFCECLEHLKKYESNFITFL